MEEAMRYKLYLDDMRYPPDDPEWRLARNYHDAIWYVKTYGVPYHVSFDHDLADVHYDQPDYGHSDDFMVSERVPYEFTGYDFAKWLCNYFQDNNVDLSDFTFHVHSANPVGAENIRNYMISFLRNWKVNGYV
jgi:hypothetical protein